MSSKIFHGCGCMEQGEEMFYCAAHKPASLSSPAAPTDSFESYRVIAAGMSEAEQTVPSQWLAWARGQATRAPETTPTTKSSTADPPPAPETKA